MKILCLLSGGVDSTVLLWHLRAEGHAVEAMAAWYGQRHALELSAAARVAGQFPCRLHRVVLPASAFQGSTLTRGAESAVLAGAPTIVPNRNMVLLSMAAALAIAGALDAVAYAAHAGDCAVYPDCRPEFVAVLRSAFHLCHDRRPDLLAPFLEWSKADVVRRGMALGVPFNLAYSCYAGGDRHCGTCGACVERRRAFVEAGVMDPAEYQR